MNTTILLKNMDIVDLRILATSLYKVLIAKSSSSTKANSLTKENNNNINKNVNNNNNNNNNKLVYGKHLIFSLGENGILWCGPNKCLKNINNKNYISNNSKNFIDDNSNNNNNNSNNYNVFNQFIVQPKEIVQNGNFFSCLILKKINFFIA